MTTTSTSGVILTKTSSVTSGNINGYLYLEDSKGADGTLVYGDVISNPGNATASLKLSVNGFWKTWHATSFRITCGAGNVTGTVWLYEITK